MIFSLAYAQTTATAASGSGGFLVQLLPLVLIFVVFYFLLIRPQQKKMKDHKQLIQNLRKGDKILTSGGIIAQVSKIISDTELQIEIAEGVKIRIARGAVSEVLNQSEKDKNDAQNETVKEEKV
ncbi:MAG: preprotein translocase subunit YajC [Alphaproteobacteria bacterium]|nr:preprotein translocase subunit YajC [Alphaproteobacteria bacterium]